MSKTKLFKYVVEQGVINRENADDSKLGRKTKLFDTLKEARPIYNQLKKDCTGYNENGYLTTKLKKIYINYKGEECDNETVEAYMVRICR